MEQHSESGTRDPCARSGTSHTLYVNLTYRCNLSCLFCASDGTNKAQNQDYKLESPNDLFAEHKTCNILHISGGEPTLCDNLVDFCSIARRRFDHILLSTNGIRCEDRSYSEKLLATRLDCLVVPFFTATEALHDSIVGRTGAFGRLGTALQVLTELCPSVETKLLIKLLLIKPAISNIHQIIDYWSRMCIEPNEVQISGLHISEKLLLHRHLIPAAEELSRAMSLLVRHLTEAQIPTSICDLPLCLLDRNALESFLQKGLLISHDETHRYTKIYSRGVRRDIYSPYRFHQCAKCALADFCDGYYFRNIKVIDDLTSRLVPITFSNGG